MRFRELRLARYGHFENRTLDFAEGACDFHVILGRNEAGKSTTMAAIGDLLFGFPHRKSQNWRFDANLLRVGATLERQKEILSCTRRRAGRKTSLYDGSDDTPLDEDALRPWLGNLTREDFERLWSLDHIRLREGGRQMAAFKDDFGQQLLAAGLGLGQIRDVLNEIENDADAIWKKNARKSELALARQRHTEANNTLRAAQHSMQEWKDCQARREIFTARFADLAKELSGLEQQNAKLERIRRILPLTREYAELDATLQGHEQPLFDPQAEELFETCATALVQAQHDLETCRQDQASLAPQREALKLAPALLADAETIEALRDSAIALKAQNAEAPAQADAIRDKESQLRVLGFKGDAAEILASLPNHAQMRALEALDKEHKRLVICRRQFEERQRTARHAFEQAQSQSLAQEVRDPAPLRFALAQAEKAGDLDTALRQSAQNLAHTQREAQDALARLTPWQGDVTALRRVVLPLSENIAKQQGDRQSLRDALATHERECLKIRHHLENLEAERAQLEALDAISPQALHDARAERDALWSTLRASWGKGTPIRTEEFTQVLETADRLADRRFDAAEQAARLGQIERDLQTARQHLQQESELHAQAKTRFDQHDKEWHDTLSAQNAPLLPPDELAAWAQRRDAALDAHARAEAAHAEHDAKTTEHSHTIAILKQNLVTPLASPKLADWLALAQSERADVEAEQARRAEQRQQREHAARDLAEAERHLLHQQQEEAAWHEQWLLTAKAANLSEIWLDERPTHLEQARRLALDIIQSREILAREQAARQQHEDAIAAAAAHHQIAPAPAHERLYALIDALKSAQENQRQAAMLDARLAECARNIARHAQAEANAQRGLAALFEKAATHDLPALRDAVQHSRQTRGRLSRRTALRERILAQGDGRDFAVLLQETTEIDPDALTAEKSQLQEEIQRRQAEQADLMREDGETAQTLRQLEERSGAREAAADLQAANADLELGAERYLASRVQALVLRHVVARQRMAAQNPLLDRAGHFFSRLTLRDYASLAVVDESGEPELVGLRPNGTAIVRIEDMSEGTADQLFLSLRLAAIDRALNRGLALPFLADDLFITFDEARALAGLEVLSEIAQRTQVLFFTHHAHLAELARKIVPHPAHDLNRFAA
ncbi:ATP-binding protein [Kozakia baliensis]|uniref:ATP-binding protein n=1 Tax=Kozakia baliensis TaxID=153496 RepID=UPI0004970C0C|nr:YhaN family protein [Kozakia baliensis]